MSPVANATVKKPNLARFPASTTRISGTNQLGVSRGLVKCSEQAYGSEQDLICLISISLRVKVALHNYNVFSIEVGAKIMVKFLHDTEKTDRSNLHKLVTAGEG